MPSDNPPYTIFEYLYRDASNYKSYGYLLLRGDFSEECQSTLEKHCEGTELFIAEQIGIPPLYEQLWTKFGGHNRDDHALHELIGLRKASSEEATELKAWGTVNDLINKFRSVQKWNLTLSPNA